MLRKRSVIIFTFNRWFIFKFMRNFALKNKLLIALSCKVVNPTFQAIVFIKAKEFMRSDLFNEITCDIISAYTKYHNIFDWLFKSKLKPFSPRSKSGTILFFFCLFQFKDIHLRESSTRLKLVSFLSDESKNSWMASQLFHLLGKRSISLKKSFRKLVNFA